MQFERKENRAGFERREPSSAASWFSIGSLGMASTVSVGSIVLFFATYYGAAANIAAYTAAQFRQEIWAALLAVFPMLYEPTVLAGFLGGSAPLSAGNGYVPLIYLATLAAHFAAGIVEHKRLRRRPAKVAVGYCAPYVAITAVLFILFSGFAGSGLAEAVGATAAQWPALVLRALAAAGATVFACGFAGAWFSARFFTEDQE